MCLEGRFKCYGRSVLGKLFQSNGDYGRRHIDQKTWGELMEDKGVMYKQTSRAGKTEHIAGWDQWDRKILGCSMIWCCFLGTESTRLLCQIAKRPQCLAGKPGHFTWSCTSSELLPHPQDSVSKSNIKATGYFDKKSYRPSFKFDLFYLLNNTYFEKASSF